MNEQTTTESISPETTVAIDPSQVNAIIEHGQANTWFLLGGMGVLAAWLFALTFLYALGGR